MRGKIQVVSKQAWWHWSAAILMTALGWAMEWLATVNLCCPPAAKWIIKMRQKLKNDIIYGLVGITCTLLGL